MPPGANFNPWCLVFLTREGVGSRPYALSDLEVCMEFFSDCCDLFTDTFNALFQVDFFSLLLGYIFVRVGLGSFLSVFHGSQQG